MVAKYELGPDETKKDDKQRTNPGFVEAGKGERAKREKKEKELIDRKAHTISREKGDKQEKPAVLSKPASYKWSPGPHGVSEATKRMTDERAKNVTVNIY
jgi:hypothetical protein